MLNVAILAVALACALALAAPRLSRAPLWRATVTPLASIIGSGFLVLGPILHASYGWAAPLVMAGLCVVAWLFGAAIRSNIRALETSPRRGAAERALETAASWTLAFAYVVSVAYYLNLLGAFGVSLTEVDDRFHARALTSCVFVLILFVGVVYGFGALERLEQASVSVKLAIIAGLLAGLAAHFGEAAAAGALVAPPPTLSPWPGLTLAFGLVVTVQGFETSRYLGARYDAQMRVRSMRLAQLLSAGVYLVYIGLLSYAFAPGALGRDETAIIDMIRVVAPVLPAMLVAAALSAQFSAAVADTGGSGGLIEELTGGRVPARAGYGLLVAIGLALTWTADVFEIISYASRAFALYYALQSAIAALSAARSAPARAAGFAALALLGLAMALLGRPAE